MNWINRKICMPPECERIVIFTPNYPKDDPMRFRIVDGRFYRILTEATHWATIEDPSDDADLI